jgi:hypothetical protein
MINRGISIACNAGHILLSGRTAKLKACSYHICIFDEYIMFDLKICSFNRMKQWLQAPWPNGKALLSGGKDCGFESHWCRIFGVLFALFLSFAYAVMLTGNKPDLTPIAPPVRYCSVEPVTMITIAFYTIISKRGTLQFSMPKSEGDPSRASAFLHTPPHERQRQRQITWY